MKKLSSILQLFIFISLSSCCFYFPSEDYSDIKSKTTYKSFEQLNHPIVFTMPVVENLYLFGNGKLGSKFKELGNVFVIYDWEKEEVYDWVFFPGEHGYNNWRSTELTPYKDRPDVICYYDACYGSGKIGCLDPTKTSISSIDYDNEAIFKCHTNAVEKVPGCGLLIGDDYEDGSKFYTIAVYDSAAEKISETFRVRTDSIGYINQPVADPSGNYWFSCIEDGYSYIYRIDTEVPSVEKFFGDDIRFIFEDDIEDIDEASNTYSIIDVEYADEDMFIARCNPLRHSVIKNRLYFYSYSGELLKEIEFEPPENTYMYAVAKVNGRFYGVCPEGYNADHYTHLMEINYEEGICKDMGIVLPIDMTEVIYTRDSRLILMSSRDQDDVYILSYDFETGEMENYININLEDFMEWK